MTVVNYNATDPATASCFLLLAFFLFSTNLIMRKDVYVLRLLCQTYFWYLQFYCILCVAPE